MVHLSLLADEIIKRKTGPAKENHVVPAAVCPSGCPSVCPCCWRVRPCPLEHKRSVFFIYSCVFTLPLCCESISLQTSSSWPVSLISNAAWRSPRRSSRISQVFWSCSVAAILPHARLRFSIISSVFCSNILGHTSASSNREWSLCDREADDEKRSRAKNPRPRGLTGNQYLFCLVLVFSRMFLKVVNVSISPCESDEFCVLTDGGGRFFWRCIANSIFTLWSDGVDSVLTLKSFIGSDLSFRLGGFVFPPLVVPSPPWSSAAAAGHRLGNSEPGRNR